MRVLFYNADITIPINKSYEQLEFAKKIFIIISNDEQYLKKFEEIYQDNLSILIEHEISDKIFLVPMTVRDTFFRLLGEIYENVHWKKKNEMVTEFNMPEIRGADAINNFFTNRMKVTEEWEVIIQHQLNSKSSQSTHIVYEQVSSSVSKWASFVIAIFSIMGLIYSMTQLGTIEDLKKKQQNQIINQYDNQQPESDVTPSVPSPPEIVSNPQDLSIPPIDVIEVINKPEENLIKIKDWLKAAKAEGYSYTLQLMLMQNQFAEKTILKIRNQNNKKINSDKLYVRRDKNNNWLLYYNIFKNKTACNQDLTELLNIKSLKKSRPYCATIKQ